MFVQVSVVDGIDVSSGKGDWKDRIVISQDGQVITVGLGDRVQDLIDALLTVNWGCQRSRNMAEIRKQRRGLSCKR